MADLEPCRSNRKRRKLDSDGNGSSSNPGSSSNGNGNRKSSTRTSSSGHLASSDPSEISFVVVDPDPPEMSSGSDGNRDSDAWSSLMWPVKGEPKPSWRFNSRYTMEELESMIDPGYFDGDRLHDPELCGCDSCKIVWEPVP